MGLALERIREYSTTSVKPLLTEKGLQFEQEIFTFGESFQSKRKLSIKPSEL